MSDSTSIYHYRGAQNEAALSTQKTSLQIITKFVSERTLDIGQHLTK